MDRPENDLLGRMEHCRLSAQSKHRRRAVRAEKNIEQGTGIHVPHNTRHDIMRENCLAESNPKKSQRRKWIRYERTYSNSMWHTDYKQLCGGRWLLCYEDDASRFVTGYSIFDHATTENTLAVLEQAIEDHGKSAPILTDRGSQFYARVRSKKEWRIQI